MNRQIIILLSFLFFCCTDAIETEYGFGEFQIGITKSNYDKQLPVSKIIYTNGMHYHYDSIYISKKLKVKNLEVYFMDDSVVSISVDYNKELYNILKEQNGVSDVGHNYVVFKTKSKNIKCMYSGFGNRKKLIVADVKIMKPF